MSFDQTKPATTDNYSTAFVPNIQANQNALATWLDSTYTTIAGTPVTYGKRYNRTSGMIEEYNTGTGWGVLAFNIPGNAATATSAGKLAAGAAGQIPWQSAPGTTGFTAAGTAGQVLVSAGAGQPVWTSSPSLTATNFTGSAAAMSVGGTAANITGVAAIANGGTGAITAALARAALGALGATDTAANATTVGGLAVASGRNNVANQIARTDAGGYLNVSYINANAGNEGNASSPPRLWGTNGSDDYMRTYLASSVSVGYASYSGNAIGYGQNWYNMTSSRSLGSNFYNGTGRPIMVSVTIQFGGGGGGNGGNLYVNGALVASVAETGYTLRGTMTAIIPVGGYCSADGVFSGYTNSTLYNWSELY